MTATQAQTPDLSYERVGDATTDDKPHRRLAVRHRPATTSDRKLGLIWLGGFKSDMDGTKAIALDQWAAEQGLSCTRFDYSGHGLSEGAFTDGTISQWTDDAETIFERITTGPQILVGSSMGGWISLLLAKRYLAKVGHDASRIRGMVLIAPAADFTERLMWTGFPDAVKETILTEGRWEKPSDYSDDPYIITRALIEDGRQNLLMDTPIETGCPVHILQGLEDPDVPWQHAEATFHNLVRDDALITFVKDGDHRLSRPQDLDLMIKALAGLISQIQM